jgi:cupin fold WbuC family metalloprotein
VSVQLISPALIDSLKQRAAAVPRRRTNHNFHAGPQDNPHRFLNVLMRGSYVPPHRHSMPPKAETFVVLEGVACIWTFNDEGKPAAAHMVGPGQPDGFGIDIAPGVWHTVAAVSDVAVCFEVKPGPWDPAADKELAPWAPVEGDAAAGEYLRSLLDSLAP